MNDRMSFDSAKALFSKYHIELSADKYDKLAMYASLMIQESDHQNITAVKSESAIWVRHFLDSAFLCSRFPDSTFSLIDIGSGGGIPGIPLAILMDQSEITLLDSELHKIEFCQKCVDRLQLNVNCVAGRAEELAKLSSYRGQFDYAVSRAMTGGNVLCELAIAYLKVNGLLYAMKGKNFDDSYERFEPAAFVMNSKVLSVDPYSLEGEDKHLIIVQKKDTTPEQYPRRFAKIKRQPL